MQEMKETYKDSDSSSVATQGESLGDDSPGDIRSQRKVSKKPTMVKISFNLTETLYEEIDELAARRGITLTEALRQSIKSEVYLQREVDRGRHVLTEDGDGENRKELALQF